MASVTSLVKTFVYNVKTVVSDLFIFTNKLGILIRGSHRATCIIKSRLIPLPDPVPVL